jgi:hypothetical protein
MTDIFIESSNPLTQHASPNLFVFFVFLSDFYNFSAFISSTYLANHISKYFIFFWVTLNALNSDFLLLFFLEMKTDFYMLIMYHETFIILGFILWVHCGFLGAVMLSINKGSFLFPFHYYAERVMKIESLSWS